MFLSYLFLVTLLFYLSTRIVLWSIEDLILHLLPTVKGIDTFSGFTIGFDIKPFSFFLIHVPTCLVRNASYFNLQQRRHGSHALYYRMLYRIEYGVHRILYRFICKTVIFHVMMYPLRWLSVSQRTVGHSSSSHSSSPRLLVARFLSAATSRIISGIHPFIHFTDTMRVSSAKGKDGGNTLSQVIMALTSNDTAVFMVERLTAECEGNVVAVDNIKCLLRFKVQCKSKVLQRLWSAQYLSMAVDSVSVHIDNADVNLIQHLRSKQGAAELKMDTKWRTLRMLRNMLPLFDTKVECDWLFEHKFVCSMDFVVVFRLKLI